MTTEPEDKVLEQLHAWRDELIDLSRRNKLLNASASRSAVLRIVQPSIHGVLVGLGLLDSNDRPHGYWRFHYPPSADLEGADPAQLAALDAEDPEITDELDDDELLTNVTSALDLSKRLRSMERQASSDFMDKGIRSLYLGLGILRWSEAQDEWVESPLVMVPVILDRPSPREPFRLRATEDDPVVNPALRVKLESDFAIDLPQFDSIDGATGVISETRRRISQQEGWSVVDQCLFGRFSFQKEAMYQDLRSNEDLIADSVLIRAIGGDPSVGDDLSFEPIDDDRLDELAPPEELSSILDADSTQRQCIVAARDGSTFVMDGPPGTGKSQTIANMIAELLAANKTVLFVSEKAAALDVVKSRLDAAHLGSSVLELHSNKATRKEVALVLGQALAERPRLERPLDPSAVDRVRRHRNDLSAYAAAQNEVREPFGRSLHWAIGHHAKLADAPQAPPPDQAGGEFARSDYDEVLDDARTLAAAWSPVALGAQFLWRDLRDSQLMGRQRGQITSRLESARTAAVRCQTEFTGSAEVLGLPAPESRSDFVGLLEIADLLGDRRTVPPIWLCSSPSVVEQRADFIRSWTHDAAVLEAALTDLATRSPTWRNLNPAVARRLTVDTASLAEVRPNLPLNERTPDDLRSVAGSLTSLAEIGPLIEAQAGELQKSLGLESVLTPEAIRSTAELARLGAVPYLPESSWFDPTELERAKKSLAEVRPLIQSYHTIANQLRNVFTDDIFRLDVESFYDGPNDVVAKMSWTSGRGRANRKQLKACTKSGKIVPEVLAAVPLIRQYRQVGFELAAKEAANAQPLSTRYYNSSLTDLAAFEDALQVADRALDILGSRPRSAAVSQRLGAGSSIAPQLAAQAETLTTLLDHWDRLVRELGISAADISTPLQVAQWSTQTLDAIQRILDDIEVVATSIPTDRVLSDIESDCVARVQIEDLERCFSDNDNQLRTELGELYQGAESEWSFIADAFEWANDLGRRLPAGISESAASRVLTAHVDADELKAVWNEYEKTCDEIVEWFGGEQRNAVDTELNGHIEDAALFLGDLLTSIDQIDDWLTFDAAATRLRGRGFGAAVDFCVDQSVPAASVANAFERAMLTQWIDQTLAVDPRCDVLRADDRDQLVSDFRRLDALLVASAASRVMEVVNARRPNGIAGPFAVVQKEAEKKRKHRPIKTLLEDAGAAALALKPCFMMSPLSVSQFLPATLQFDAVIFDEASQVRPCDAVGAIYRGRQLIVSGDNKQLPPTNFFDKSATDDSDEYDEDALEVFDSVLELCRGAASIRDLPLRWHYRSRHEDLITYSNRAFYNNRLVTYPGATRQSTDLGVEFIHVPDGIYRRGAGQDNQIEAQRVVERILLHADRHPNDTLGVVAFSEAQATRIEWELEAARRRRPDLDAYFHESRLDGFFVKNLESVQGDERDIIIFSVGYGRDETGKLTMNFGPLNKPGGQRRLNVAITRARKRVEVVSSINASDFSDSANAGVHHLRGYLDFAEHGVQALSPITVSAGEPESPFEEEVLDTLRRWGHDVEPQVGQAGYRIDMAIRHPEHPGKWLLGIECDGAAYHSSATARDRDRLRQQVLEGLGWRLHRIWGPSWYHRRSAMEAALKDAIESALRGEPKPMVSANTSTSVVVDTVDLDASVTPDWVMPYQVANLNHLPEPPTWDTAQAPSAMTSWVEEIVRQEGPISAELLLKRIRDHWHAEGARSRFRRLVEDVTRSLVAVGQISKDDDGFLISLRSTPLDQPRVPIAGDHSSVRVAHDTPPSEVRKAILRLVEDVHQIDRSDIRVRIARLFGWGRTGSVITEKIDDCINELMRDGALNEGPAGILALPPA